jgi:uncharacterized DUF497 family protein
VVDWVWDPEKDRRNRAKHGLPLAAGAAVLIGDPLAVSVPDVHPDGDRWQTVGSAGGIAVLVVIHTEPRLSWGREVGRIISVRRATAEERRRYEEEGN